MTTKAEWIDILKPAEKDLTLLQKRFHIHPVILEELKTPSARDRVETHPGYLYLIYYLPVYDPKEETSRHAEIDFLITKNAVVTVGYEWLEALSNFKNETSENSLKLAHQIISALLNFQERQLRHIRDGIETISGLLFKNREKEVLQKISRLKRDISEYRIIVKHQALILKSLLERGRNFWGADSEVYLNDLIGNHLKIVTQLEDYRETIADFEDTNNQLMNIKINDVMKTFTILSFLTFPFVLIATLFGIRASGTPIVDLPGAFWIISGSIAAIMIALVTYFKKQGWF